MFGRTLKSSIAKDNGRSTEFIKKRQYLDKSRCYECGEEGHLSYACPANALGERQPPPKKERKRKKKEDDQVGRLYFIQLSLIFPKEIGSFICNGKCKNWMD